jgi:hypothetical protein
MSNALVGLMMIGASALTAYMTVVLLSGAILLGAGLALASALSWVATVIASDNLDGLG